MRTILILSIALALAFTAYSAEYITVPDVADSLYIGQVLPVEIDMSKYKPERLYMDRKSGAEQLELFELQPIADKPYHFLLRLAPFDTGQLTTDRIPLFTLNDGVADTFYVEPFSFYVKSSLAPEDTLQDIAPPVPFFLKFWDYTVPIIALLLIVATIYLILKYSKKKVVEQVVEDTRPAWVIAMDMLTAFKQKHYLENGLFLNFYFELSLIFRFFIERQHNIKAVEMTTYEIKQFLQDIPNKQKIIQLLQEMDMIKFAKTIPIETQARDALIWIENYILSFNSEVQDNV